MKWSLKIGTYKGIPVYIHATFILVILWVAISHWMQGHDFNTTVNGIIFVLLLFTFVVFHEFGHALMARRYNIVTRDITLLPIGGLARLERMPDKPAQELWVALAGPAVNVVISAILFVWLYVTAQFQPLMDLTMTTGPLLERLMVVNLFLAGFNLLPAFPMDGGRVVRALLAMRMEYSRATQVAASIGQGMALIFGFLGFFGNPTLLFIAFFVWIGAAQEAQMAKVRYVLDGIPVRSAMITDFKTLYPGDTLKRAVELILAGSQHDFPVTVDGSVVGILERKTLMTALSQFGQDARVGDVMARQFQSIGVMDMLQAAMARLQSCDCHIMPVLSNNGLAGLLTMENVGEFMMIHAALQHNRS
ncbi:site-2 protease family protein [candidate division KSB1 bacterium]|nr:site-2 protease family protein [candidate division KSB1 bacterium]